MPSIEFVTRDENEGEVVDVGPMIAPSKPRPEVSIAITAVELGAGSNLTVTVQWTVRDELSDLAHDFAERVQELRFKVNGSVISTVSNLAPLAEPPGELPWQPHRFLISGSTTLSIPAPGDLDDLAETVLWGGRCLLIEAETSRNAAGRTGWDQSAVQFAWQEGFQSDAIDVMFVGDDPTGPQVYSLVIHSIVTRDGSDEGSFDPMVFRIPLLTEDTAQTLGITENSIEQALRSFTYSPPKHYVVRVNADGQPQNQPVVLVVTADALPAGLTTIKPSNLVLESRNGRSAWVVTDDYGHTLTSASVEIADHGLITILGGTEARSGPTNLGQVTSAYMLMYGTEGAQLLQLYQQGGNFIFVEDVFGQLDVDYWVRSDHKVLIRVEEDVDPFTAAQLLATGLKQALGLPPVQQAVEVNMTDPDQFIQAYNARFSAAAGVASAGANMYLSGLMVATDTGGDIVCFASDAMEGKWKSALVSLGSIAFVGISATAAQRVVLRDAAFGPNLMEITQPGILALRHAQGVTQVVDKYNTLISHFPNVADRLKLAQADFFGKVLTESGCLKNAKRRRLEIDDLPQGRVLHHDCPVEHQDWFLAHGIDINHPDFTRWVHDVPHRNILHKGNTPQNPGGLWNKRWREFRELEINGIIYTREQVIAKVQELRAADEFTIP